MVQVATYAINSAGQLVVTADGEISEKILPAKLYYTT